MLACRNNLCFKKQGTSIELLPIIDKNDVMTIKYQWSTRLICTQCKCIYYNCRNCDKRKNEFQVILRSDLCKHHRESHTKAPEMQSKKVPSNSTSKSYRTSKKQKFNHGCKKWNTTKVL